MTLKERFFDFALLTVVHVLHVQFFIALFLKCALIAVLHDWVKMHDIFAVSIQKSHLINMHIVD